MPARARPVRTPPQVVAESNQPTGALLSFITRALEAADFDVVTSGVDIGVLVNGERYAVGIGGIGGRQLARARQDLQSCLELLERR